MEKFIKGSTAWTHFLRRQKYQEKRHTVKWKRRKRNKKIEKHRYVIKVREHKIAPYIDHKAPDNFSCINNTNEVLNYFSEAKRIYYKKQNVNFDISNVSQLTPDTIALLVASIKSPSFTSTGNSKGNEPKKEDFKKLFSESGFYEHVTQATGFKKSQPGNLLHKEVSQKVAPDIAKNACITGLQHVFQESTPSSSLCDIHSSLYEILLECMANTHNHANLSKQGECRWWLYVYNNPKTNSTLYTFIDLGVGIFKSAHTKNYIKKIFKKTGLYQNIKLVDDLLAGKIHSRIEKDRELRGKGIPQIVKHSKNSWFKSFYIITNNVKIDLTNGINEPLEHDFEGTLLHWELIKV